MTRERHILQHQVDDGEVLDAGQQDQGLVWVGVGDGAVPDVEVADGNHLEEVDHVDQNNRCEEGQDVSSGEVGHRHEEDIVVVVVVVQIDGNFCRRILHLFGIHPHKRPGREDIDPVDSEDLEEAHSDLDKKRVHSVQDVVDMAPNRP